MALLAEELVEEWLNRQGYFTIRGIKIGVHEIDLLAILPTKDATDRRQIEVQASVRPVSYITRVPRAVQKATGRAPNSALVRDDGELRQGVKEWVDKKFNHPDKEALRQHLCQGVWSRELVVHVVKHPQEIELIQEAGVTVHRLVDIVASLKAGGSLLDGAAGSSLLDLVAMTAGMERADA